MQQAVHRRRTAVQPPRRIAQAQPLQHHALQHQALLLPQRLKFRQH
jgi:hypothetical protein